MMFLYGNKPFDNGQGAQLVPLYFIKSGRDGKAPLDGSVITNAYNDFEPLKGTPVVSMQMDGMGTKMWRKLTAANLKRKVAIVLDNQVYSAPVVQSEIPNGSSQISGNFTIEEAKDLANILKAGRMPVPTRIVEEVVVGPSLGAESIRQGLMSILIGLGVIVFFMIAYYAKSGIVANLAVLINILLILGMLVPMDAVLTLPGIAGIVLTIGMAVDANVLINERIKDELAMGTPMELAVKNGYNLASTSIWDANITTMIAGVVLMFFGSGPVQGFATTLVIGIFTSLLTSVYITRIITEWRMSKGVKMTFSTSFSKGLFKNVNYNFVAKRKIAYVASSVIIGAGLVSLFISGLNYGVDFEGGWSYIVTAEKPVDTEALRNKLEPFLQGKPEVKTYGAADRIKITTTFEIDNSSEDAAALVQSKLEEGLNSATDNKYSVLQGSKVGPTIARDIKSKSITAMIIAMMGIFAYIWVRFRKWEYALGSTIAVIHDTLIIITAYTLLKDVLPFSLEIDQNFIAAILTIIGFSVNDNVVIFDRIREQFREDGGKTNKETLINQALNYTFSRTVITASTVFVVVLILLLFGGETIRGLSFALLIGVITGTYSTIYIAVPFLIDAGSKDDAKAGAAVPAKA
jgi:SecD/SecF fusion protein